MEATAEKDGDESAEGLELAKPHTPRVEAVVGGPLIEIGDAVLDDVGVGLCAFEWVDVAEESARLAHGVEIEAFGLGEVMEQVLADAVGAADRTF